MLKLQSSLKVACMAAAALAAIGCSQDDLTNQSALIGNTTIEASFEEAGIGTRTSVNEANKVVWNKNDAFGLFYTSATQTSPKAEKFTASIADGTSTSALFGGTLNDGATTSYAVYPYQEDMSLNSNTVTMKLPAEFNYTTASNGPMYAPASNISESLSFKHLTGLLKLTISKGITADAKKFVITADKDIAGTCTADLSATSPVLAVSSSGASKTITVNLNITDDGKGNITTFYIPIPTGTYTTLSAKLLGDGDTQLFEPKEWTNVTVERAGMMTASFRYVKIDADTQKGIEDEIREAIPTDPQTMPISTELAISSTIDATSGSGINSIPIPVAQNSNVVLSLESVPTTSADKPLELKDNSATITDPTTALNTVTLAIPKVTEASSAPNIAINMPQTTVELDATGTEGTTYGKIIAKTASNTLVIKKGVTVKELVVEGGNVRVAGKIEAISKDESLTDATVYLIKEAGVTLPASTDGFTVIDAATYDMKTAFAKGEKYVLTTDASIRGASVVVPAGKEVTLDLNGHTLTAANKSGDNILVEGKLTLKDSSNPSNGQIVASEDYSADYTTTLIYVNGENASMTMESGTIYAVRTNPTDKGQFGVGVYDGADFTMTGGKIEAGWYAVAGNGNYKTQNSIINITGGELISTADYALYLPQAGTTTISGGKIYGAAGGATIQRGTLNVDGTALITSKGTGNTGSWGDGTGKLGCAAINANAAYDNCTVNIKGGTLTAESEALISTGTAHTATINVTGGTFSDPSALAYMAADANVNIKLSADKTCKGFKTVSGQTLTIDLGGKTLTLADPTVGSTGTETNSCQLLEGSTVTFKNGTLMSENNKIMIQNYCNLTLEGMTVTGTNAQYVVSNNCGNVTINNTTINAGSNENQYAFDVCGFSKYTAGVSVTVQGTSIINGKVEISKSSGNTEPMKLNITDGTFNGDLVVDSSITDAASIITISGSPTFTGNTWDSYKSN